MNAVVNQGFEFLGIPANISLLFVDDEGRKPKQPVTQLFPETQRRLGVDDANVDAMTVEVGDVFDPGR